MELLNPAAKKDQCRARIRRLREGATRNLRTPHCRRNTTGCIFRHAEWRGQFPIRAEFGKNGRVFVKVTLQSSGFRDYVTDDQPRAAGLHLDWLL